MFLALEFGATFWGGVIVVTLFLAVLVPFLIKENTDGKAQLRLGTPAGAGDVRPGRPGNPAPGQPDGQADPYDLQAQR